MLLLKVLQGLKIYAYSHKSNSFSICLVAILTVIFFKKMCKRNAENHAFNKVPNTTGTKSLARIIEDEVKFVL